MTLIFDLNINKPLKVSPVAGAVKMYSKHRVTIRRRHCDIKVVIINMPCIGELGLDGPY